MDVFCKIGINVNFASCSVVRIGNVLVENKVMLPLNQTLQLNKQNTDRHTPTHIHKI